MAEASEAVESGGFLNALGADLAAGGDAILKFIKTPGDVLAGKYTQSELAPLAREYAGNMLGAGMTGSAPAGSLRSILGYHGTPHTFKPKPEAPLGAFEDRAIGSGEGAQVYGWGHYVAGNPKVAEEYQKQLSSKSPTFVAKSDGQVYSVPEAVQELHGKMMDRFPDRHPEELLTEADSAIAALQPNNSSAYWKQFVAPETQKLAESMFHYKPPGKGNLYAVHIKPDEHELLDWDKSLKDQSPQVRELLEPTIQKTLESINKARADYKNGVRRPLMKAERDALMPLSREDFDEYDGKRLYRMIGSALGKTEEQAYPLASEHLHNLGVPGIRYADAGSRNIPNAIKQAEVAYRMGQDAVANVTNDLRYARKDTPGDVPALEETLARQQSNLQKAQKELDDLRGLKPTSNYVIFHPDNLRITGRNGEMLGATPVDHDPFAGAP